MFAYLKGILTTIQPNYVIVEVHGIGYFLSIPGRLVAELPMIGQAVQLYTTFVVRELSQTLYGFLNGQERDAFEILMNVTGIGPKLALSLIGSLTFRELEHAIMNQEFAVLCRVPGVGKKTAERLVVELKDKLPQLLAITPASLAIQVSDPQLQFSRDALQALMNLGYSQQMAQKAITLSLKEISEDADLPLLITTALKHV
jgi:holliday junction DNA helicase RuvA